MVSVLDQAEGLSLPNMKSVFLAQRDAVSRGAVLGHTKGGRSTHRVQPGVTQSMSMIAERNVEGRGPGIPNGHMGIGHVEAWRQGAKNAPKHSRMN